MDDPFVEHVRRALAPEFEVERELARGGMGRVVLARERSLDRLVAIKTIRPELATAADEPEDRSEEGSDPDQTEDEARPRGRRATARGCASARSSRESRPPGANHGRRAERPTVPPPRPARGG